MGTSATVSDAARGVWTNALPCGRYITLHNCNPAVVSADVLAVLNGVNSLFDLLYFSTMLRILIYRASLVGA